jgi:hypothetical protein
MLAGMDAQNSPKMAALAGIRSRIGVYLLEVPARSHPGGSHRLAALRALKQQYVDVLDNWLIV